MNDLVRVLRGQRIVDELLAAAGRVTCASCRYAVWDGTSNPCPDCGPLRKIQEALR